MKFGILPYEKEKIGLKFKIGYNWFTLVKISQDDGMLTLRNDVTRKETEHWRPTLILWDILVDYDGNPVYVNDLLINFP